MSIASASHARSERSTSAGFGSTSASADAVSGASARSALSNRQRTAQQAAASRSSGSSDGSVSHAFAQPLHDDRPLGQRLDRVMRSLERRQRLALEQLDCGAELPACGVELRGATQLVERLPAPGRDAPAAFLQVHDIRDRPPGAAVYRLGAGRRDRAFGPGVRPARIAPEQSTDSVAGGHHRDGAAVVLAAHAREVRQVPRAPLRIGGGDIVGAFGRAARGNEAEKRLVATADDPFDPGPRLLVLGAGRRKHQRHVPGGRDGRYGIIAATGFGSLVTAPEYDSLHQTAPTASARISSSRRPDPQRGSKHRPRSLMQSGRTSSRFERGRVRTCQEPGPAVDNAGHHVVAPLARTSQQKRHDLAGERPRTAR